MDKNFLLFWLRLATLGSMQAMQPVIESYHAAPGWPDAAETTHTAEVLRVNEEIVGFVQYDAFDLTLLTFNFGRYGLIYRMTAHRGYETMLLKHTIGKLKELHVSTIMTEIAGDNAEVLAFFIHEGFSCPTPDRSSELENILLKLKVDVPADKLPKGNLIQQHPKTALAVSAAAVASFLYLAFKQ